MKKSLFNSEAPLWALLGIFGELLLLSLLWFLCSVPLVTAGAASAALYDTVVHCIRNKEEDIFSRYFRTLKNELLSSVPTAVLWEVLIVGLFLLLRLYTGSAGTSRSEYIAAIAFIILWIFVLGCGCWVFPVQSRFTFGFAALTVSSVKLAFSSPLRTLLLGLVTALSAWLCIRFIVPVMLLPALNALVSSYVIEPVFGKYI